MKEKTIISDRNKGVFFIILSAFCFALMNVFVRMAGDLPFIQKSFFRNFVSCLDINEKAGNKNIYA